ncbi:hypothetical protein MUK42_03013 [Musa troglodytarum]|uniref:Uncharacterized protein n=2 Tax=Musa troglodytarum TaxID=320322 RepID=A0A9E7K460_9LILI|nr:hypothetical protein MUK42_03013 [Musa troglodytarum]
MSSHLRACEQEVEHLLQGSSDACLPAAALKVVNGALHVAVSETISAEVLAARPVPMADATRSLLAPTDSAASAHTKQPQRSSSHPKPLLPCLSRSIGREACDGRSQPRYRECCMDLSLPDEERNRGASDPKMKCIHHPYEDGPGVCASCLRDRLLALVAPRTECSLGHPSTPQPRPLPLPLPLPPSACPLACRRESDSSAPNHNLSCGAPEVGPSSSVSRRSGSGKLCILSVLFGHHPKSEEPKRDTRRPKSPVSSHWVPTLTHGRRKKKISRLFRGRSYRLNPWCPWDVVAFDALLPAGDTAKHHHRHWRRLAGFAMCLNPLVRPSPGRRQILGGSRHDHRPPAGSEVALCPNRSRNLADVRGFRQRFGPIIARYSPSLIHGIFDLGLPLVPALVVVDRGRPSGTEEGWGLAVVLGVERCLLWQFVSVETDPT